MTRSRQRSIGSWLRAVWEMPYPGWIVRCFASLGVDLEERRKQGSVTRSHTTARPP